jgi:hypothetical protein
MALFGFANERVAELGRRFFIDRINRGWVVDALIESRGLLLHTPPGVSRGRARAAPEGIGA